MLEWGASPKALSLWTAKKTVTEFEIWPDNAPAVQLFLAVATQWRWIGVRPVSLDYGAVEAGARMAGIVITPRLFGKLRTMEAAALRAMAGRRRR